MALAPDPSAPLQPEDLADASADGLVLALDAASPVVSVAVGRAGVALAVRSVELRKSSERLLSLLEEVLDEAGLRFADLDAAVALAGPGSFTGLRVGLATVLGFHQATGLRVAALPTLPVLALAGGLESGPVWAVVDAIRGEWFAQEFALEPGAPPRAVGSAAILTTPELLARDPRRVVGFGVQRLATDFPGPRHEPTELASAALRAVALDPPNWDPTGLCHPLYLRAPEVSLPTPRRQAHPVSAPEATA